MPIRVVMRTTPNISPFKRILNKLVEAPFGDTLLLCSGYIWEPHLCQKKYRVLDDGLLNAIVSGCKNGNVITVAGKFDDKGKWEEYYRNFVCRIRSNGINITPYIASGRNWHAKVAMKLEKNRPLAAIIGSSNLTSPAYQEGQDNWNFEADVLIWAQNATLTNYFRNRNEITSVDGIGLIETILDPDIKQLNEVQQMEGIYKSVFNHENLQRFD